MNMCRKSQIESVKLLDQKSIVAYLAPRGDLRRELFIDKTTQGDTMDTSDDSLKRSSDQAELDEPASKRLREGDMNEIQRQSRDLFDAYLTLLQNYKPPKKQKKRDEEETKDEDKKNESRSEESEGPKFDHESFDPFVEYDRVALETSKKREIPLTTRTSITTGRTGYSNDDVVGLLNSQQRRSEKESNVFGHILDISSRVKQAEVERKKIRNITQTCLFQSKRKIYTTRW
jgi:hypothetical protein